MAEYIEREATIELLRSLGSRDYRREKGTIQEAIKMVSFPEYTPSAERRMIMSIKCLLNGLEVNYPCSPSCALFGDCVTAFESQKKANVRTNADRIRAMSDEELAEFLGDWAQRHRAWMCDSQGECLAWLQEPAEGE